MRGRQVPFIGLMISALALVGFLLLASVFKQDSFLQRDLALTQRIHANEESVLALAYRFGLDKYIATIYNAPIPHGRGYGEIQQWPNKNRS
jgi:hypothetical protein